MATESLVKLLNRAVDKINNIMKTERSLSAKELLQDTIAVTATETIIGSEIDVQLYDNICVWVEYTNGDEDYFLLIPKFLHTTSDVEFEFVEWDSAGGIKSATEGKLKIDATKNRYIQLGLDSINYVAFYGDSVGAAPTGTVKITYTLSNR